MKKRLRNTELQMPEELRVRNQDELAALVCFMYMPEEVREQAEHLRIGETSFVDEVCRSTWRDLVVIEDNNKGKISEAVYRGLGILSADRNSFDEARCKDAQNSLLDHFLVNTKADVIRCMARLADLQYRRTLCEVVQNVLRNHPKCLPRYLQETLLKELEEIPLPPIDEDEPPDEDESDNCDIQEIPNELLHVPNFIDSLVEYTMKTAHKPNRTLAFGGALALLAHLAGRQYTDKLNTSPNLYIINVAGTGAGKNHPRSVNARILDTCGLGNTLQESFASGPAVEEVLYRNPVTLVQWDEIQKVMRRLGNLRDDVAQGISESLMTLYSPAGGVHRIRAKAEDSGRTAVNPCLTLYGTGVPRGVYKNMTPELIGEGFVGRCLILDTETEGKNEDLLNRPKDLPNAIVKAVEFFAQAAARQTAENGRNQIVAPYAAGVYERFVAIKDDITAFKQKCKKSGFEEGEALWGRADEKVSKLALVYAISVDQVNPEITMEAMNWAWALVQTLINRMLQRIQKWNVSSAMRETAEKVIKFLKQQKGRSATQRDVKNSIKLYDPKEVAALRTSMVEDGYIKVISPRTNSFTWILINDGKKKGR